MERGQVASHRASLAVLQLLSPYPKGSKHPDQRELRKNEGTTLIQDRKIAMTVVLSSFFHDNNNKRRRGKKRDPKSLRSGSGIRN